MLLLKKTSLWAALLGIVAIGLLVRETTAVEPMPEPLSEPARKPHARGIGASGILEALRENTAIGAPIAGLIRSVQVSTWDKVKAGDPLFQLDDRELQAQLRVQEAEVRTQEAQLRKAHRAHERTATLRGTGAVSEDEADARDDEWALQKARLESAQASVSQTKVLLDRLIIRAPIDGVILQVNIRTGEYLAPTAVSPPVLLGSIDEIQVRADVDEQVAPRVRPGAPATGYLKGDTTNPIALEFVRIEPYITPKVSLTGSSSERVDTRVLQVIYKFPNDLGRRVYVGQQIDLFIEEP